MRFHHVIGVLFIVAGLWFSYNSQASNRDETRWGYASTGILCLLIGAGFAGLIWFRDTSGSKGNRPHPLE